MQFNHVIPILRIFSVEKAKEFYLGFLGMKVDWEHRFEEGKPPVYMQVSRDGLVLHLSEHHGDATPGSNTFVEMSGLRDFHSEISARGYPYMAPGFDVPPWGGLCMEVIDPFGNRIRFAERS